MHSSTPSDQERLNKVLMTGAERQRRYMEKFTRKAGPEAAARPPRPRPTPEEVAARAKAAEIELAAMAARLEAAVNPGLSAELAAAKAHIAELERQLQAARAANGAGGKPGNEMAKLRKCG